MRAKVTKAFPGRPDGDVVARTIDVGETIHGELAVVAVREKWAEPVEGDEIGGDVAETAPAKNRRKR